MSGVAFLLIVVVVSVIGSLIVWARNRQPSNSMSSVGDFQREMQALGSQPPAVANGHLETHPRKRVNTVQVRPNLPTHDDEPSTEQSRTDESRTDEPSTDGAPVHDPDGPEAVDDSSSTHESDPR